MLSRMSQNTKMQISFLWILSRPKYFSQIWIMHIITHKSEMQYLEFMLMCNSTPFEIVLLSSCDGVVLSICASAVRFISTIYENKLFLNVFHRCKWKKIRSSHISYVNILRLKYEIRCVYIDSSTYSFVTLHLYRTYSKTRLMICNQV